MLIFLGALLADAVVVREGALSDSQTQLTSSIKEQGQAHWAVTDLDTAKLAKIFEESRRGLREWLEGEDEEWETTTGTFKVLPVGHSSDVHIPLGLHGTSFAKYQSILESGFKFSGKDAPGKTGDLLGLGGPYMYAFWGMDEEAKLPSIPGDLLAYYARKKVKKHQTMDDPDRPVLVLFGILKDDLKGKKVLTLTGDAKNEVWNRVAKTRSWQPNDPQPSNVSQQYDMVVTPADSANHVELLVKESMTQQVKAFGYVELKDDSLAEEGVEFENNTGRRGGGGRSDAGGRSEAGGRHQTARKKGSTRDNRSLPLVFTKRGKRIRGLRSLIPRFVKTE